MGQPAAKQGDQVMATDIHMVIVPPNSSPVPLPHPFTGIINGGLSSDVNIMGMPAATVDSTAQNTPAHIPLGTGFQQPPTNQATIRMGSPTVKINVHSAKNATRQPPAETLRGRPVPRSPAKVNVRRGSLTLLPPPPSVRLMH